MTTETVEKPVAEKPAAAAEKAADLQPTSQPAARAANHTSAARYNVTLTLDPHVWEFYTKKAAADDRTLAKYLARELRATAPPLPAGKDEKF
jgi:hypothetical protein